MCSVSGNPKKMRVSNDWTTIFEFSELHKEIITNLFSTHFNGKQKNVELWEDLATKLNSLGQGGRSVEEWKKKLADWKSKTKAKSAKIYKYIHGTGGGPSINIKLTTLEEKLLSLMVTAAAYGDKTVAEKGLKRKLNEHVEEKKQSLGPNGARSEEYIKGPVKRDPRNSSKNQSVELILQHGTDPADENIIIEEVMLDHEYTIIPTLENDEQEVVKCTTTKNDFKNNNEKVKNTSKNSRVDVNAMHENVLTSLENINNNICKIANSFQTLVDHFCQ